MSDNSIINLNQRGTFARPRQFELLQARQLRVTQPLGRRMQTYSIDVLALDPSGRRRFTVSWIWLGILLTGLLSSWLAIVFLADLDSKLPFILSLVISGSLAALGTLMFFRSLTRRRVFVSLYAHVPLVDLLVNNPDRENYRNFLAHLEDAIKQAQEQITLPKEKRIAGEMRTLRRLSEEGVVNPEIYEHAKTKLLRKY